MYHAWAEINISNIIHNFNQIKNFLGNTQIMAIIKSDAYGHGAVQIAQALQKNGANCFGVANYKEGMLLRNSGIGIPIMITCTSFKQHFEDIIDNDLTQTVSDLEVAKEISKIATKKKKQTTIEIMIDTGMGRLGFEPVLNTVDKILQISKLSCIKISGVYSHLAMGESELNTSFSNEQFEKFLFVIQELKNRGLTDFKSHICASGGILNNPKMHLDMVRPGLILYGSYPSKETARHLDLKPALSLKAKICYIDRIKKGTTLGYDRTFLTKRDTTLAIINIGYAHGYPSVLGNRAQVIVGDSLAPVIGKISMDQTMIDITDIPQAKIEDTVTLIGKQNNLQIKTEDLAAISESKCSEILTMCNMPNIPRVYIDAPT